MPSCNPSTNDPPPAETPRRIPDRSVSSLLRPRSVALILLSLGVFFWGFGYRLSLYQVQHESTARASVVRMWVESKSARTLHVPARNYAFAVADVDWTPRNPFLLFEIGRTTIPSAPESLGATLQSLLPSRAPPQAISHGPVQG